MARHAGSDPPVLDPAFVATRSFPRSFRGFATAHVRQYLEALAGLLQHEAARGADLVGRLAEAEQKLSVPAKLDEHELTVMLGAETTRVLESARQAAAEIRAKGEQNAAQLLRDAHDEVAAITTSADAYAAEARSAADGIVEAQRREAEDQASSIRAAAETDAAALRAQAASVLTERIEEAEAVASRARTEADEILADAERQAEALRQTTAADLDALRASAAAEAEAELEAARHEGRGMVAEARALRERMLSDLGARRRAGRAQLEMLRRTRETLLSALDGMRDHIDAAAHDVAVAVPDDLSVAAAEEIARRDADDDATVAEMLAATQPSPAHDDVRPAPSAEATGAGDDDDGAAHEPSAELTDQADGDAVTEADDETAAITAATAAEPEADANAAAHDGGADRSAGKDAVDEVVIDLSDQKSSEPPDTVELPERSEGDPRPPAVASPPPTSQDAERNHTAGAQDEATTLRSLLLPARRASAGTATGERSDVAEGERLGPAEHHDEAQAVRPGSDSGPPTITMEPLTAPVAVPINGNGNVNGNRNGNAEGAGTDSAPPDGVGIDALFAEIRSSRQRTVIEAREILAEDLAEAEGDAAGSPASGSVDRADLPAAPEPASEAERTSRAEPVEPVEPVEHEQAVETAGVTADHGAPVAAEAAIAGPVAIGGAPLDEVSALLLERRDAATGEIERRLAKRLKRLLSDEENDVLDQVRRARNAPTAEDVLPERAAHAGRYAGAAVGDLAGAAAVGAELFGAAPVLVANVDDIADELAGELVRQLRGRVERCFEEANGAEAELDQSIRACYREWKTQRIADASRHHVLAAFTRGLFEAAPAATAFRWIVDDGGTPCPDAEDNALAGDVVKGEPFPTGHACPPAHPGCRCLIVPVASDAPA